jgi:hypothetical protein
MKSSGEEVKLETSASTKDDASLVETPPRKKSAGDGTQGINPPGASTPEPSPADEKQPVLPVIKPPRRLFAANSLIPSILRAILVVLIVIGLSALVFRYRRTWSAGRSPFNPNLSISPSSR